jgi:hypothetical protein
MKIGMLCLISAAVVFSSASEGVAQSRLLTEAEKRIIADAYGRDLRDPKSAQYEWAPFPLKLKGNETVSMYCFRANAKNGYGAFVGYKLIVGRVDLSAGKIIGFSYIMGRADDTPELARITEDFCRKLGPLA